MVELPTHFTEEHMLAKFITPNSRGHRCPGFNKNLLLFLMASIKATISDKGALTKGTALLKSL